MRILRYDEVDPLEAVRLSTAAFHRALQPEQIEALVRKEPRHAYGYGVYAVERGRVLAQAVPLRFPVRLRSGVEPVGGIAGVCSLPSEWGRGFARRLMEHLHAMFRADGLRIAALTTSRNIRGYGLYARLGYVDLAPFFVGTKALRGPRRRPDGVRVRRAHTRDHGAMHALYREATEGLLGWTERSAAELPAHTAIFPTERACYRVAFRGPRLVGYFRTHTDGGCLLEEVVAPRERDFRGIVAAAEAGAATRLATVE